MVCSKIMRDEAALKTRQLCLISIISKKCGFSNQIGMDLRYSTGSERALLSSPRNGWTSALWGGCFHK